MTTILWITVLAVLIAFALLFLLNKDTNERLDELRTQYNCEIAAMNGKIIVQMRHGSTPVGIMKSVCGQSTSVMITQLSLKKTDIPAAERFEYMLLETANYLRHDLGLRSYRFFVLEQFSTDDAALCKQLGFTHTKSSNRLKRNMR